MLNTFPHLLVLGFFAPTLLRIALAIIFFYSAYHLAGHLKEARSTQLPLVGVIPGVGIMTLIAFAGIGGFLLVGAYTQVAAILAAITGLKGILWGKRMPYFFPFAKSTYALVAIIALSLIISGAGAMAMDLPL